MKCVTWGPCIIQYALVALYATKMDTMTAIDDQYFFDNCHFFHIDKQFETLENEVGTAYSLHGCGHNTVLYGFCIQILGESNARITPFQINC